MFARTRIFVVAAVLVTTVQQACAGNLRIAFIDPTSPPSFWNLVTETMRAAASELNATVEVRETGHSYDTAIAVTKSILNENPPPDYLIASNDVAAGGDIIKLCEAAHTKLLLLNNDLDRKDWPEFGEPRTKYHYWIGSIVPDHEGAGYDIGIAILTAAAKVKADRPLNVLALTGDKTTPAATERLRGLKRAIGVMSQLLGPGSIQLVGERFLDDWTQKTAEAGAREFLKTGTHIDAVWAANDPMALGALAALRDNGYRPGVDVMVGGLNWSQEAIDRVLDGQMVLTHGGHFLLGAWAVILLRDYNDGRDFAEEDVRLQVPMGAIDLEVARRFPKIGEIDWRQVDFTQFSKTRNPALKHYEFTPDAVLTQLQPTILTHSK